MAGKPNERAKTAAPKSRPEPLTDEQKYQVFHLALEAVPGMTDAEFLRAVTKHGAEWGAATEVEAIAPVLIEEIHNFRLANPDPGSAYYPVPGDANVTQSVRLAPDRAKIGY